MLSSLILNSGSLPLIFAKSASKSFKLYEEGILIQEKVVGVGTDATGTYNPTIGNDLRPSGERYPYNHLLHQFENGILSFL